MNNIIKRKWNQNSMVIIEDLQGMAFQAESGGHTFQISGIDGEGNTVALSGTPAGVMLRADGQDVALTCSASGGVVSATLPANAYSVPGRFGLTIFLTSDGQKTAIYAAVGTVGKTSSGTVAPPAGSDVVTLVNQINAAIAAIPVSYNSSFAPAYSTSGLYSVGQYVTYNGNLYRCNTAITTAETWTAAHWTQTNLGADVYDLKSAVSSYENLLCSVDSDYTYAVSFPVVGYYPYWNDNGNLRENANYTATPFISIRGVKSFGFSGVSSDVNAVCFYDSSFAYISGGYDKKAWDVPSTAYYMRMGILTADISTFQIRMELFMDEIKEDSIKGDIALDYLESDMPFYYDSGNYGQAGSPYSPSNIIKAGTKIISLDVYCTANNTLKIGFWRTSNNSYYGEKEFVVNPGLNHLFLNVDVEYDSRIVFNVFGTVRYVGQSTGYAITEVSISNNTVTAGGTLNNYGLYATIQYLYKDETSNPNELHVGVGQEFTTINAALTKAYALESISNPITIIVHPGVYNEVLFIGGTHYVSIIGTNRDDCIVKDGSADYNKAPIRIAGQAYVANMTFIETAEDYVSAYGSGTGKSAWKTDVLAGKAKYDWLGTMIAYAVHCDDTTNGENTICRFENCKMYSECGPAFGGGMQINEYIQLVNCELITNFDEDVYNYSITTTGKTGIAQGTFLCHGKNNGTSMKLLVKDCTIETNIGRVLEMYIVGSDNDALIKFIDTMFYSNKLGSASSYYHWNFNSNQISGLSHGNNIGFLNKPNLAE
jgi:hypothetical protein